MEDTHEMELVAEHNPGWEEWYCYACGHHFMMLDWQPMERVVLTIGNDIIHQGGKILKMGGAEVRSPNSELKELLDSLDFNSL